MKISKLLAPALALGLYACGEQPKKQNLSLYRYVSPAERREMIQKEVNENPRAFVERYGKEAGTERFDFAVGASINRGFVLEDGTYNRLVDSINGRYSGLVDCYTEYSAGARGQSCKKSIERLQEQHRLMNNKRERAKKKVQPVKVIPELRNSYY